METVIVISNAILKYNEIIKGIKNTITPRRENTKKREYSTIYLLKSIEYL